MHRVQKVLFIIPNLRCGGSERVITNLLKFIDKTKFKLSLAILDTSNAIFLKEIPDSVKIIDLKCSRIRKAPFKIIKLINQTKPDTVLSTLSHLNILLGLLKPFLPKNTKVIARESAVVSKLLENSKFKKIWHLTYRILYNRIDLVICQSVFMQKDLILNFGIRDEKTKVVYNPLDKYKIKEMAELNYDIFEKNTINVVASGRLSEEKGFDILIKGLALSKRTDIKLNILGSGHLEESLQQLAYENNLKDQVRFLGHIENPYPYYKQANAFILSSLHEGLPNVVLEALACGTPVISTPATGGVSEILSEVADCQILEFITPESISYGLKNFDYSNRIPSSVTEKYDVNKIVKQYESELVNHACI